MGQSHTQQISVKESMETAELQVGYTPLLKHVKIKR